MPLVSPMTPSSRLRWTALMFAVALVFLVIASLTHEVWPLFVGWIPLLAVPWILTRPETAEPRDATVASGSLPPESTDRSERPSAD
jgi:hypothetical protein